METIKLIELLQKYEYPKVLSICYAPTEKKVRIIWELLTGTRRLDEFEFVDEYNDYCFKCSQLISRGKNG